jgi:hypothetical protein
MLLAGHPERGRVGAEDEGGGPGSGSGRGRACGIKWSSQLKITFDPLQDLWIWAFFAF